MTKFKTKVHNLDCDKCNTKESVKYTVKDDGEYITAKINKCTNCSYQYGIKELFKLNEGKKGRANDSEQRRSASD